MKKYMPLEGLRWSRDSGSALCDTSQNSRSRTGWGVFLLSLTFLLKEQSDVFIPYYEMAYRLLMMPLACLVMECLKIKRLNLFLQWFGRYSLEIYVLQMLVIGLAQKELEAMNCPLSLIPVLHTLLTFAIVIGVCVPIHNGIDKLINKIE